VTSDLANTSADAPEGPQSGASWRVVANRCHSGACPTVYQNHSGDLRVQGYAVIPEQVGVTLPAGVALVEIPSHLLAEALREIGN
jgi:hypothetical protein